MYMKRGWQQNVGIVSNRSGPNLLETISGRNSRANDVGHQLDVVGENSEIKPFRAGQQ
jgi:hypothetical protein